MNILLIGECYSYNLGDGVLCNVTKSYLEQNINKICVSMFDMSLTEKFSKQEKQDFNMNKQNVLYSKKIIGDILSFCGINIRENRMAKSYSQLMSKLDDEKNKTHPHAIVFAGGQMFNETFISRIEMIVSYAEKEEIPVFFNACGCGLHLQYTLKNRIKKILNSNIVRYVSLRDGYDHIQPLTKKCIVNTLDTALVVSDYYNMEIKEDIVGIGIMVSKNQCVAKQMKFWMKMLTLLNISGYKFQLFCNGDPKDYAFAEYLLKNMGLYKENSIAECPIIPEDLIRTISKYSCIISMRLHSLIVAYSYGVPAIAISWDRKVEEFYHKIGNDNYCFTMNSNADDIFTKLTELKSNNAFFAQKNRSNKIVYNNMNNIVELLKNNIM